MERRAALHRRVSLSVELMRTRITVCGDDLMAEA